MSTLPTRWVLVDDTSPDINYRGKSWFSQIGNPISIEDSGLPFKNTLHGTNTNASLTFNFSGPAITVKGTVNIPNAPSPDNPSWVCLVDGVQIGSTISHAPPGDTIENHWIYCQNFKLKDGPHTLTLDATANEQTFWFDRIEYAPSASVPLANKTISVAGASDADLHFSPGWGFGSTSQTGAYLTFDFVGTFLTWWTQYVSDGNSTTVTWSIDGQNEQTAPLQEHKDTPSLSSQKVFDTGPLSMGTHHLKVTYNGGSGDTPLVLSSMFIENGTSAAPTGGSTSSPTSGAINTKLTGLIIGGVVGVVSLLLIFVIASLFVFCRRRRRDSNKLTAVDKFDVAPGHAPHADSSKPHNFYQDSDRTDSLDNNPGHILLSQPMPRKLRDNLGLQSADVVGRPATPNGQITQDVSPFRQPMPRKALENLALTRGRLDQPVNRAVTLLPIGPSKGRIVVHQDSGVRLNNQAPASALVDTPPEYN